MKKLLSIMILVLVASVSFGQLGSPLTQKKADARYLLKSDSITASSILVLKADSSATLGKKYATGKMLKDGLDLKANLSSPELTGTPTAPTAATQTSNTQIANTAFVYTHSKLLDDVSLMQNWMGGDLLPVGATLDGTTGNITLTDNRAVLVTFVAKETATYISATIYIATAFSGTPDQENGLAIYSVGTNVDANLIDLVANSKVVDANFYTSTGLKTAVFSSPITLTKGKEYKLALLYNYSSQSTAPVVLRMGNAPSINTWFGTNYISARINGVNTFPSTFAFTAAAADNAILGVTLNK